MSKNLKDTVKRLEAYNNASFPILSVYFTLPDKDILSSFKKFITSSLSKSDKKKMKQNIEYMEGFLQNYSNKNGDKSFAFFTGDAILFEVIHLPYTIENKVVISHSPYLNPLLQQQSNYRHYLVIFIDREKAKYFLLQQGVVEAQGQIIDKTVPQNVHPDTAEANNITREDKINRHIQDHLRRHYEKIVSNIVTFIGNTPISGVIIGGHKNLFSGFRKKLPKSLQGKVVGVFTSELHTNLNDLMQKSIAVIDNVDEAFNQQQSPYLVK